MPLHCVREQTADGWLNAARQLQSAVESISGQVSKRVSVWSRISLLVTHASRKDMDHSGDGHRKKLMKLSI